MQSADLPAQSEASPDATPVTKAARGFDTAAVLTIAGAHFTHDLYPAFIGPLLPLLIAKHGMTMAAAGGLATVIRWPSVAQPFMGYLADRWDARKFVVLPPLITAACICMLGWAANYFALAALLLIAGASSAVFHPAASGMVTRVGGMQWGRASSYFSTGGELGRALGPIFITSLVAAVGFGNIWLAIIPGALITLLTYSQVSGRSAHIAQKTEPGRLMEAVRARGGALLLLSGVVIFRSLSLAGFQTFFPAYMVENGASLVFAGMALTFYEIGGVGGTFLGGSLSDRFGRRTMMAISQLTAGPILFSALALSQEPIGMGLLAVGGLLALSAAPVQLTLAQELLPQNRSVASGVVMFLGFEGAVVANLAIGFVADRLGLQTALSFSVLGSMLSLPLTVLLPRTSPETA